MLKTLKPKIILVDWKFIFTLSNNVMKIIRAACKEMPLNSQR